MSACLSVAFPDRILVYVDSAIVDLHTGVLIGIGEKALRTASPPAVIAFQGDTADAGRFANETLGPAFQGARSFCHALENVAEALSARRVPEDHPGRYSNALLAGFADDGSPRQVVVCSGPTSLGLDPAKLHPALDVWLMAAVTVAELAADGIQLADAGENPDKVARAIFAHARQKLVGAAQFSGVGGQLCRITVTPAGTSMKVIGYWLDRLGEPLVRQAKLFPVL